MKYKYFFIVLVFFYQQSFGQVWEEQNSGVSVQLNSIAVSTAMWCCGNNGTVLKNNSLYGMSTWRNISGNGIPGNAVLVHIAGSNQNGYPYDTSSALVAGNIGTTTFVWRTSNSGENWTQVFSQANGSINGIWNWPGSFTFMQGNPVGGRWSLWKSTNFGLTWDSSGLYLPQAGTEQGWANSLFSWNPNLFWFGTNNSRIYHTSTSGNNWSALSTSPEQNIYALNMSSMYLAGGATLLKSTNSGLNWIQIPAMGSGNFGGVISIQQYYWYVRSDNKIYMSSNSGTSWVVHHTAPAGNYRCLFGAQIPWGYCIYAIRDNGGISRYVTFLGIKQISTEIPKEFKLYQNYPNPFNPVTKIRFDFPPLAPKGEQETRLVIYNSLGQEIETLVNDKLEGGEYEVEWDGSAYTSGVYFYKLTCGNFTDSRKMILIK